MYWPFLGPEAGGLSGGWAGWGCACRETRSGSFWALGCATGVQGPQGSGQALEELQLESRVRPEPRRGSEGTWRQEGWGSQGKGVWGLVATACPGPGKGEGRARAAGRWRGCAGSRASLTGSSAPCCASRGQSWREGSRLPGLLGMTAAQWLCCRSPPGRWADARQLLPQGRCYSLRS